MQPAISANGTPITSNMSTLHCFPQGGIQVALSHTVHTHVDETYPEDDAETEGRRSELKLHTLDVV